MASPYSFLFDEAFIRDALTKHDPSGPIFVALFFRYRKTVEYPKGGSQDFSSLPQCSGQEAMMQRYLPKVMETQAAFGFGQTLIHMGPVIGTLHSKYEEQWDDMVVVKMEQ